jgi:hypothetical protein
MWRPFDDGVTVGRLGSEGGIIVRDEEHVLGARATLEQGSSNAPWAVACGVYGWFFHTRFLGSEAEAEFPAMLDGLAGILDLIPGRDDPGTESKFTAVNERIHEFISCFP